MKRQILLVGGYLCAIVAANLLVAKFGTWITPINAFVFVGLDITTRDLLHELWHKNLWLKMGILVASGSFLSWLLNKDAGMIAIASFVAFGVSAFVDTITYAILSKRHYLVKVNGSNVCSSLTDSILFPTIAFGVFMPWVILAQFGAKVGGGFLWGLVLNTRKKHVVVDTFRA